MKKQILAAPAALLAISACAVPVHAEPEHPLPFTLTAPEYVSVVRVEDDSFPNTCEVHYSQSNAMSEWADSMSADYLQAAQVLNELGYSDLWITAQIDWSLDTQDDWHYDAYWDTGGYDADGVLRVGGWGYVNQNYTEEISMSDWIFRNMGNVSDLADKAWYGQHTGEADHGGWKDVLHADQYTVAADGDASYAEIDFTAHTLYVRVRWLVSARDMDMAEITVASDWSETAAVGKDAAAMSALTADDLEAPVIRDLRMTDETFGGYPMAACKLDVSETLAAQLARVNGSQGGITLEIEASVYGKETWVSLQGDFPIKSAELKLALQALAEAEDGAVTAETPIAVRARYLCKQSGQEDFYSAYSEMLTLGDAVDAGNAGQSGENAASGAIKEFGMKEWLWLFLIIDAFLIVILLFSILFVLLARRRRQRR